jgi:hypothetical protein
MRIYVNGKNGTCTFFYCNLELTLKTTENPEPCSLNNFFLTEPPRLDRWTWDPFDNERRWFQGNQH